MSLAVRWLNSGASSVVAAVAPANTAVPTLTGTATAGQTLTATSGSWTGNPEPTFAYQWQRGTTNISGETASTYTLQTADIGSTVRVVVTATNASGSASANSANSATVQVAGGTAPAFVPANQTVFDVLMAVNTTGTPINAAAWFTGTVSSYSLVDALPNGPGLVAGITINGSTGVITLTPTIDGESYVQVAATNGGATAYSDGIRISVHP